MAKQSHMSAVTPLSGVQGLQHILDYIHRDITALNRVKPSGEQIHSSNDTVHIIWDEANGRLDITVDYDALNITLATVTTNGLLAAADYVHIRDWVNRIPILESGLQALQQTVRMAARLGAAPTQTQLTDYWSTRRQGQAPVYGATIVNLDQSSPQGHAWTYLLFDGNPMWIDRGIDTVGVANETNLGIVRGSTEYWQNQVTADGRVMLNYRMADATNYGLLSAEDWLRLDAVKDIVGGTLTYVPVMYPT